MSGKDKKAYHGWRAVISASLEHHPDKFSKEACKKKGTGKLCPYAIFTTMKKKGNTPHYKEQPHTTSGKPSKKKEFKNESEICKCGHYKKSHAIAGQGRSNLPCEHPDCDCDNFTLNESFSFEKYVKNRDLTESSSKEYQQGYTAGKAGHDEPCPYKDDTQRSDWLNGYEDGFKYAKWDDKDKPNWNKPKKMSVNVLNASLDMP